MILYQITIPGRLPVKKNTARHFRYGVIYSKAWKKWEKEAIKIIQDKIGKAVFNPIDEYCHLDMKFHFKSHQWEADVSNLCEGPQDVLESCGILQNDKFIAKLTALKIFGDEEKTEIIIRSLKTPQNEI